MALADGYLDRETGLLKISWSRVRMAGECRQKEYRTSMGQASPIVDQRMFVQGNVCDMAMGRWLEQDDPQLGWMADQVDLILDEVVAGGVVRWRHSADREQVRKFCKECVTRLEPLLQRFALPYLYEPHVRFKERIVIPVGMDGQTRPVLLTGEKDLLTRAPDGHRVWDLKATKDASYWRKTVSQLVFYDLAVLAKFGVPVVEAGLLQPMIFDQPYISFRPSDQDRMEMYQRVVTVANNIWREDFAPKAGTEGCSHCECRGTCIRYQPSGGRTGPAVLPVV
jgi:hypothetical protein